jgi:hypothetical protein
VLAFLFALGSHAEANRVRKSRRLLRPVKKNLHRIGNARVARRAEIDAYAESLLLASEGLEWQQHLRRVK